MVVTCVPDRSCRQISEAQSWGGDELHCRKEIAAGLWAFFSVCALQKLFSPFICVLLELIVSLRQRGRSGARKRSRRAQEAADVLRQRPRFTRAFITAAALHKDIHERIIRHT